MDQVAQNINKDMIEADLIDLDSLDFSDDQTWLYVVPGDSGQRVDINEWKLSCHWLYDKDPELHTMTVTMSKAGNASAILLVLLMSMGVVEHLGVPTAHDDVAIPDKHKFDSRTYVKPKKRVQRPSIQSVVEVVSNPPSIIQNSPLGQSVNKYLTYNKYNNPLGAISPMLRLKTFNVDINTDNSNAVKEYAMKRRSLVPDDDPQLEDLDVALTAETTEPSGPIASRPINIDLSQPANNLQNTFNKGLTNILNERGSLNMYQSGESLTRMSPPSLVSSLLMESSGTFNAESLDSRKSIASYKDAGLPITSGRESIDPMMTSMSLSILDDKDMNTSFFSQTTFPDNESLIDSLPPSLVSSVNSSYVINTKPKTEATDSNIFSSATFTHLEQSERLLSARPRCQLYNSYTKRESGIRNTESYTKSREEACQIDQVNKILNENSDNKDPPKITKANDMSETITLHFANNKYKNKDAEKENLNETFETDDAFYRDNGLQKVSELVKNSMNVTCDKQELNEIKQARQKLSLARRGLPIEPDKPLPKQVDTTAVKIQLPNQTITVPRQSVESVSELMKRRSQNLNNHLTSEEPPRETPKRNATFRKVSPRQSATVVYVKSDENKIIDINSATMNLIGAGQNTLQQEEWGSQETAMVGSSESTDTGTFSSSSPPESVPDTARHPHYMPRQSVESVSELMKRRSQNLNNHLTSEEPPRETPKRNATFRKVSPRQSATVVYVKSDENKIIDINSATMNLIGAGQNTLQQEEWGSQETAMVGSSESTDTGTFSSSSPPESVPDTARQPHYTCEVASTPLVSKKASKNELLQTTISPIYAVQDKSYVLGKAHSAEMEQTYDVNTTVILNNGNAANNTPKRDLGNVSTEKITPPGTVVKVSPSRISPTSTGPYSSMAPPTCVPKRANLPTSKLRQYSSHRELNRIPGSNPSGLVTPRTSIGRAMVRRGVYASNPALSPTSPQPAPHLTPHPSHPHTTTTTTATAPPIRRESYTVAVDQNPLDEKDKQTQKPSVPVLVRQGTETLRRERPQSQLVAPKDQAPTSRPHVTSSATITRVSRPTSVPTQRPVAAVDSRPFTAVDSRVSALPRPSRLPAPRRTIRPPSVYSVAPTADIDHY
ncbi:hypothetical protein RR46_01486 [Papilio xuthus]|uniref:Uncharacterized protein n=1 Tax=Papilio xuthus TaxID=66420 RepID=A0A0N0P9Q0_PAPXU|nr:hypothetical protein RR46_01486 [Papilio xuthus]